MTRSHSSGSMHRLSAYLLVVLLAMGALALGPTPASAAPGAGDGAPAGPSTPGRAPSPGDDDERSRSSATPSASPPVQCGPGSGPRAWVPGVGRGKAGDGPPVSCCVVAGERRGEGPPEGTGWRQWPDCARSEGEHSAAAWEAASRVRESRQLLADLAANPLPPTAVPSAPDTSACPTVTQVAKSYYPENFNEIVLSNFLGGSSWWSVEGDGAWDESECPTFTVAPLQDLEFMASPDAVLGPDTAARLSVFLNGGHKVAYFATDFDSYLNFLPAGTITGGAIGRVAQFFLDESWCSDCQFNGTVYQDVDLSQGSGIPGGVKVATAAGAEFNWVHFTDLDLDGADLSRARFNAIPGRPASLQDVSMRGANLSNAVFDMSDGQGVLTGVDFTGANLGCIQFRGVVFAEDVTFEGATWGTDCADPHFDDVVMEIETLATIASPDAHIESSSIHVASPGARSALKAADGGVTDLSWLRFTNSHFFGYPLDLGAQIGGGEAISDQVVLSGAVLDGSRLTGANLQGVDLSGASLKNTLLTGADLWLANLTGAEAANADFRTARVWDATFTGASLTGADFAGADAHGAQFGSVTAPRASFAGAYLFPGGAQGNTPVSFSGSNLSNADFSGALLGEANFEGAATRLVGARFTDAQCISCNFTNATMVASGQGVDFRGAYLYGTTFATSLAQADFTGATCCATIPPGQASLAWEFSAYVPSGQGIAGPSVLYDDSDLAAADVQGATCPDGSLAGSSGCTGSQVTGTNPGRLGCVSAYVYTCPPDITTRVGNGTRGYDPSNQFALTSPLGDPADVVVTSSALVFSDPTNHLVRVVTNVNSPDPIIANLAGTGVAGSSGDGGPAVDAQLSTPMGLAIRDTDGAIAVADRDADVVRLVTTDGGITTIAGDGTACADPTGACGDGAPATAAQLNGPTTVWFAPNDDLYIADTGNHRIRSVDADTGEISTIAGDGTTCTTQAAPACGDGGAATAAQLGSPRGGLVGDAHGNLYVSDPATGRVRLIDSSQHMQSFTAQGALASPTGIAIDASGNRYIADEAAHAIYRIAAVGIPIPRLWAGISGTPCPDPTASTDPCGDNGLASGATFHRPTGLFVAPGAPLALYVADTSDQRVRVISAPF